MGAGVAAFGHHRAAVAASVDDGGFVVLLTPKAGHPDHVDASEIEEAAVTAGLHTAGGASVSTEWSSVRLVAPRGARR